MSTETPSEGPTIEFTDELVRRTDPDGRVEEVRWDDLGRVLLMTVQAGPFAEDVFVVLAAEDEESGCVVPHSLLDDDLLARLQKLPGFDNEALIRALADPDDSTTWLWSSAWSQS